MGFVCSLFFSDNGTLIRRIGLHQLLIENKKSRGYFCSPNNVKVNVKTLVVDLKFVQFCRLFFSDNGTLIRRIGLYQLLIENKKSRGYFCNPNNVKVNIKTPVVDLWTFANEDQDEDFAIVKHCSL